MNKFIWTVKNHELVGKYEDYTAIASFIDSIMEDNLYYLQPKSPYWQLRIFWNEGGLSKLFYFLQELIEWVENNILSKEEKTVKEIVE